MIHLISVYDGHGIFVLGILWGMEMVMVVFLLALSDKDPELKARLRSVLDFYRENRELLKALAAIPTEEAEVREIKKDSPAVNGESLRILDEFLKKI